MADEREASGGTSSEETPIEKSIMAGESCDFQPLFNENVVRAVTLQVSNRFFRLHLNDLAPLFNENIVRSITYCLCRVHFM